MSLEEIVDNSRTDKNTWHSYLPLYQNLLISKKEISILNMFLVQFLNLGNKHRLKDEFN